MALSTELISQFAKIVTPKETRPEFTTVTGRAKLYDGKMYVQIDGSNGQLTPIASSTVGLKDNDWVTVQIKNHSATVTGNATDPSAGKSYADDIKGQVDDVSDQISEFEIIIADKVDTDQLIAVNGRIDNLVSENATITGKLDAVEADISELTADNVTINEKLTAAEADIENLTTTKLDASIADIKYATIENLEATNADIHNLEVDYGSFKQLTTDNFTAVNGSISNLDAEKLDATEAALKYANIDFANIGSAAIENFFSKSGMIEDLVVGSGTIAGKLVGVTIVGDLIEGGTVKADKLVVQGEDGLYYKLNVTGETVAAEQTEYNSLNGSIITAQSITADKISVNDLVAFGATIGGFHITDSSLYSGVKESALNTTRGVFMNDDGEFSVGDSNNYFRYFKDTDGTYKLEISAAQIKLGTSSKPIDEYISDEISDVAADMTTEYYVSTSATELVGGSWSETSPTWSAGSYIWIRTKTTKKDGTVTYSNPACTTGAPGTPGSPGSPGEDGRGIVSTAVTYQAHSSQTSAPTGEWTETVPELSTALPYLWTRTVITYDDESTTTAYSVSSTLESVGVGGRNFLHDSGQDRTATKESDSEIIIGESLDVSTYGLAILKSGTNIVISFEHKGSVAGLPIRPYLYSVSASGDETTEGIETIAHATLDPVYTTTDWTRSVFYAVLTADAPGMFKVVADTYTGSSGQTYNFRNAKVEVGNIATDWTPAPEDTQQDISNVQDSANAAIDDVNERVNSAELSIDSINDTIQSLVIGEDGQSMMTQTEDGFRFDFSSFQEQIQNAIDGVESVQGEFADASADIDSLKESMTYLTDLNSYIEMGDDSGTPYIELGQKEGAFKVRITNTEMAFMQGTDKIAYITNNQLYIQSSVVTDEMKIGSPSGFIWKKRANNHMGLRWVDL